MTKRPWLSHYPAGVPHEVDAGAYASLAHLLEDGLRRYAARPAFRFMGRSHTFAQVDAMSRALAAWLQAQDVRRGDRVALIMPNVPQFPVAAVGVLRAGGVLVNVDPQHGARELEHQLKDAGADTIVVFESAAQTLQQVLPALPRKRIVIASTGDLLGPVRGTLANHLARNVRKLVPAYRIPGAHAFNEVLAAGRQLPLHAPGLGPGDIALLQYTGGTTGMSKAAVLLHRNLVANVLQVEAWSRPALRGLAPGEQEHVACALPLHHIHGFTCGLMLGMHKGACGILLPNAREPSALLKELALHRFHSFPAVGALFDAVARHPDAARVDWGALRLALGGGMPVPQATARLWLEKTGRPICEGYGMSETSPSASANPTDAAGAGGGGTIGLPLPSTDMRVLDDDGRELPAGTAGEIAIKGPQVMAGYWQRPDETAKAMTADGWFRSGDIGVMDERGRFRIVDRKKDMILVGGFNVYPNEIENVVTALPGVLECAAVGVPDARSGEAVKLVIVRGDDRLDEPAVRDYCEAHLAGYKRPRVVEFRAELPKTAVGRVLRRELRG